MQRIETLFHFFVTLTTQMISGNTKERAGVSPGMAGTKVHMLIDVRLTSCI